MPLLAVVSRCSQVEGQTAQDRQVVGVVTGTDVPFVLPKGHVQDPVQTVLNTPVAAGLQQSRTSAGRLEV
ncbi:MAG: hypothetical protein F4Z18_03590 [Caldilineaceae bacterium SB0666_bin_21]|nr:hypothetical protein [Caldilineaceae bacterium SB0666_bin_21]